VGDGSELGSGIELVLVLELEIPKLPSSRTRTSSTGDLRGRERGAVKEHRKEGVER